MLSVSPTKRDGRASLDAATSVQIETTTRSNHDQEDTDTPVTSNTTPVLRKEGYVGDTTNTTNEWLRLFRQHSTLAPYVPLNTPKYLPRKANVGIAFDDVEGSVHSQRQHNQSRVHLSASSGVRFPYQLIFSRIENIPLPTIVTDSYLSSGGTLECELRLSLFDLESSTFFGKTWISPRAIDVRTSKTLRSSVQQKRKKGDAEDKVATIDAEDQDSDETSDESDYTDDEDENDGSEGDFDMNNITGHRATISLRNQFVYFHTPIKSPHVIVVAEFVFIVDKTLVTHSASVRTSTTKKAKITVNGETEKISGGWTFFHLFNPEKNGINADAAWSTNEDDEDENDEDENGPKIVPIFNGTPRVLPFVSSLIMTVLSGYPGLSPSPGAILSYRIITRPDIRSICPLWAENAFIGTGDNIPGIASLSLRTITSQPSQTAYLSQIHVNVTPSISAFEEKFLSRLAKQHFEENPTSMTPDAYGHLPQPTVLERRLHVGFHNSYGFLGSPTIITLSPLFEEDVQGTELGFKGHIELDHFVPEDKLVSLVFIVEHKVQLKVNAPTDTKRKNALLAWLEKWGQSNPRVDDSGQITIDKFIITAWGVWSPYDLTNDAISLNLHSGPLHNPYVNFVYSPLFETYEDSDLSLDVLSKPFQLSFEFGETPGRSSPSPTPMKANATETMGQEKVAPEIIPQQRTSRGPKQPPVVQEEVDAGEQEMVAPPSLSVEEYSPFPLPAPSKLRSQISRVEKARLLNAGFEYLLDENKQRPYQVNLNGVDVSQLTWDLGKEVKDGRNDEVCVTFMGVTFNEDCFQRLAERFPSSVYFTFQFYTFPYATTEKLKVYTGSLPPLYEQASRHRSSSVPQKSNMKRSWSNHSSVQEPRGDEILWPGILYRYDRDGSPAYDRAPGTTLRYLNRKDEAFPSYNPRYGRSGLPRYMGQNHLHIDVWDADTFLHLGSACVDLKPGLRQGRSGVYFDDDVDIVLNEFADDVVDQGLMRSPTNRSVASLSQTLERKQRNLKIGTLHVRVTNIGHSDVHSTSQQGNQNGLDVKEMVVVPDFHDAVRHRLPGTHDPQRLPESDAELKSVLSETYKTRMESRQAENVSTMPSSDVPLSDHERRLQKASRIMQRENLSNGRDESASAVTSTPGSFVYQMTREERERDLQTITVFRERRKTTLISSFLKKQITSTHVVHASFGQGYFFEFLFTNPYNVDHNFEVSWDDDELRLVLDASEWKYLRRVHDLRVGVEPKILDYKGDGCAEVFLGPEETISIPFVFQSFSAGFFGTVSDVVDDFNPRKNIGLTDPGISPRVISVYFLNSKKLPISILDVQVKPSSYFVDRALRLFRGESELVRKLVRFPMKSSGQGQPLYSFDGTNPNQKYVLCNNREVVCSLSDNTRQDSAIKELTFKHRVGSAPDVQAIYFLFYHDPFHVSVHEIWRVFVHSLYRFDANCIFGQTNPTSLILRGPSSSRTVMAYSSMPNEVIVAAPGPFGLSANSLNEAQLLLRPKFIGNTEAILNVVDVDSNYLVSSWLIVSHCSPPPVTKSFEISMPVGKSSNKRVSYTNPFLHRKVLHLKTNSPHLLQFKEALIDMEAGGTGYLGLRFTPCNKAQQAEILVFLNDEQDKIEECLSIRVHYVSKD